MAAVVIADASPLIALARVNGLGWLEHLFAEVLVTEVVLGEVLTGRHPETEQPIQQAIAAGWLRAATEGSSDPDHGEQDPGEGLQQVGHLPVARPQRLTRQGEQHDPHPPVGRSIAASSGVTAESPAW